MTTSSRFGSPLLAVAALGAALSVACGGSGLTGGEMAERADAGDGVCTVGCGELGDDAGPAQDKGSGANEGTDGGALDDTDGGAGGGVDTGTNGKEDAGPMQGTDGGITGTPDAGEGSSGLDPNVAPGANFDLTGFQLQLPIGATDSPTFISGSQLTGPTPFTDIYFFTDKTTGAMTFMDPTTGVTTSGSKHPRSELREVTNGWSTSGTNTETVSVAVTEVPATVTIGQIFQSAPAPSKPLMELQYLKGGTLQVLLEDTNQGGSATYHKVGTVTDGAKFTYELSLTGTDIKVTINGAATTLTLPPTFVGETFYFKCGDYDQTAVSGTPGTTAGTIVKVYSLDIVHT